MTTFFPLAVTAPPTVTLGGLTFWSFNGVLADVYTETAIGAAATQSAVEQADADATQIQKDYVRSYATRPLVYALATKGTFGQAAQAIGGANTPIWAAGVCICGGLHPNWIFVNWQDQTSGPPTTLRHELTHVMEHQLAPFTSLTPTWFDEGNARIEEFTIANTQWWAAVQRYRAASMSLNNATFTLFELISGSTWSARSAADASYAYALAAQAVLFLRADIGMSGELLIFDLMRQGKSFYDAYDIVAGRSYLDFQAEFTTRVRALAAAPGVATAADTPEGLGLTFILYGLPPNTSFTLSISGTDSSIPSTRTADAYGFYYSYLDTQWRPGPYTITGTWGGGSVSGSALKTH